MSPHPSPLRDDEAPQSRQPRDRIGAEDQHQTPIPAHVIDVKDGLLDFNRFVGLEAMLQVLGSENADESDEHIPLHAFKANRDDAKPSQRARDREFLENAQKFSKGAKTLEDSFADENQWRRLFRTTINHRMDDFHSSASAFLSTIVCTENEIWDTDFDHLRDLLAASKPDFCFGFPIHNESQQISGFRNDPSLRNYTNGTLSQLAMKGLRSGPITSSRTDASNMKPGNTETQPQSFCFPWCIVQLKGPKQVTTTAGIEKLGLEVFDEASIAASDALVLQEKLARYADVKQDGQHIPPVVAITSIGPNTTVWLAFSEIVDSQHRSQEMLSIWNGRVSNIWGAVQFCRIMDNIFVWSQHILRPKVTHYIDQWKFRYCCEVPSQHSKLEEDAETADLIHRIQDRLSSLSMSPNSNLPELIQQAVILQEVIRTNPPNPAVLSIDRPGSNAREEMEAFGKNSSLPTPDIPSETASGGSMAGRTERHGHESKGAEDEGAEHHLRGENRNYTECTSVGSQNKASLCQNLPEATATVLDCTPIQPGVYTCVGSIVTKHKEDQLHMEGKFSSLSNVTFVAGPSQKPPSDKHHPKPESHISSRTEPGNDGRAAFSYPYEFKKSDFDVREHRTMATAKSGSTSATQPNPATSTSFLLSFDVENWWAILEEAPTRELARVSRERMKRPRRSALLSGNNEEDEKYVAQRSQRRRSPRVEDSGRSQTKIGTTLDIKIPWRGRNIRVKLPPAVPSGGGLTARLKAE